QIPVQDLLIIPTQDTMMAVLDCAYRVYQSAAKLCLKKYSMRALTADEGGLAPPFHDIDDLFNDALEAINMAGYTAGKEVTLAVDVASSNFYQQGKYQFSDQWVDSEEMIDILTGWVTKYPIISLEDGLAEDDWDHWPLLKKKISNRSLVVGDDLLCTNPARIEKAMKKDAANTLLLKVNQIGTLTEALRAYKLARKYGWQVTISARSGETEDNWLADLAAGWQGDQIKIGSIAQSERLAKYNRLLEIESETGLQIISWPR
ncbi:MAG: phosphopyruvate hydratase, partial [Cyclobacteriaceae bacterium]